MTKMLKYLTMQDEGCPLLQQVPFLPSAQSSPPATSTTTTSQTKVSSIIEPQIRSSHTKALESRSSSYWILWPDGAANKPHH